MSSRSPSPSTAAINDLKLAPSPNATSLPDPTSSSKTLEAALWKEVASLQSDGPTQAEVDRARNVDLTGKIIGLQRLGGFGGVADTLDLYNQYTGDPGYLPKDIARYQTATIASVKQVASQDLGDNQSVVVDCVPGKKVVDDVPRSPDNTDANVKITQPYTASSGAAGLAQDPAGSRPTVASTFPCPKPSR